MITVYVMFEQRQLQSSCIFPLPIREESCSSADLPVIMSRHMQLQSHHLFHVLARHRTVLQTYPWLRLDQGLDTRRHMHLQSHHIFHVLVRLLTVLQTYMWLHLDQGQV